MCGLYQKLGRVEASRGSAPFPGGAQPVATGPCTRSTRAALGAWRCERPVRTRPSAPPASYLKMKTQPVRACRALSVVPSARSVQRPELPAICFVAGSVSAPVQVASVSVRDSTCASSFSKPAKASARPRRSRSPSTARTPVASVQSSPSPAVVRVQPSGRAASCAARTLSVPLRIRTPAPSAVPSVAAVRSTTPAPPPTTAFSPPRCQARRWSRRV